MKENSPGAVPAVSLIAATDNGVELLSATPTEQRKAGNWYQIELDFPLPVSTNQIKVYVKSTSQATGFYVDDFRICPMDASMISYVYNEWGELSHILDNNNLYREYRYDPMGRLKSVHQESFQYGTVKTNETEYHYADVNQH